MITNLLSKRLKIVLLSVVLAVPVARGSIIETARQIKVGLSNNSVVYGVRNKMVEATYQRAKGQILDLFNDDDDNGSESNQVVVGGGSESQTITGELRQRFLFDFSEIAEGVLENTSVHSLSEELRDDLERAGIVVTPENGRIGWADDDNAALALFEAIVKRAVNYLLENYEYVRDSVLEIVGLGLSDEEVEGLESFLDRAVVQLQQLSNTTSLDLFIDSVERGDELLHEFCDSYLKKSIENIIPETKGRLMEIKEILRETFLGIRGVSNPLALAIVFFAVYIQFNLDAKFEGLARSFEEEAPRRLKDFLLSCIAKISSKISDPMKAAFRRVWNTLYGFAPGIRFLLESIENALNSYTNRLEEQSGSFEEEQ